MSDPIISVTEDRVTVTANASEDVIREGAGFKAKDEPEAAPAEKSVERDEAGKFKAKAPEAAAEKPAEAKPAEKSEDAGNPRTSHQARINQAIGKQREAERKAAALEAELQRLKSPAPAQSSPTTPPQPAAAKPRYVELVAKYQNDADYPKWDDFVDAGFADPYTAYNAAQSAFINEKLEEHRIETRKASEREQSHKQRLNDVHTEGATKYADWDALFERPEASELLLPDAVLEEIFLHHDSSADVVHHLLTHPEDLQGLQGMTDPVAAARAIARLPIGVTSAVSGPESTPRPQTKAKPLIKPVSSAPVAAEASDPDDLPFGPKYIAAMNAKDKKERMAQRGA